jgi:hypothetical protein
MKYGETRSELLDDPEQTADSRPEQHAHAVWLVRSVE